MSKKNLKMRPSAKTFANIPPRLKEFVSKKYKIDFHHRKHVSQQGIRLPEIQECEHFGEKI